MILKFNRSTNDHNKETESTNALIQSPVKTDRETSNETGNTKTNVETKSRTLQRAGVECNDDYFVDDRSEINIDFQKYRMVFVVNKDALLYKTFSLLQARKVS